MVCWCVCAWGGDLDTEPKGGKKEKKKFEVWSETSKGKKRRVEREGWTYKGPLERGSPGTGRKQRGTIAFKQKVLLVGK